VERRHPADDAAAPCRTIGSLRQANKIFVISARFGRGPHSYRHEPVRSLRAHDSRRARFPAGSRTRTPRRELFPAIRDVNKTSPPAHREKNKHLGKLTRPFFRSLRLRAWFHLALSRGDGTGGRDRPTRGQTGPQAEAIYLEQNQKTAARRIL